MQSLSFRDVGKASRRKFLSVVPLGAAALARAAEPAQTKPAAQAAISEASYTPQDYPIQPKRYSEVKVKDAFWKPRIDRNAEVTIPFEVRKLGSESARGLGGGVLEAAILSLATHPNATLQSQVDARVRELKQSPGRGNGGFEIASTYFAVTGKRDLVDVAVKSADALYENFKQHDPPFSGGERDAINCVQLYLATRDKKHLDLAKHYLDIRGRADSVNRSRHNQSYKPVLEQSEAVGHAVNCASLMVSLADVGTLTGIKDYFDAASRMWQDAVSRKFYITGGIGSSGNEGFGEPYSLPNLSAYCETCAVLMFITLNHRMFLATGDSRYIDVMERGMYNNALSGISQSGDRFFYVNRTASAGDGRDTRWERASLECCPPNLVRFLAWMPQYIYAQDSKGAVYVNLYVSSDASFQMNGKTVSLSMDSQMPWGGTSRLTVSAKEDVAGSIKLRVPGWARNHPAPGSLYSYTNKLEGQVSLSINGRKTIAAVDKTGYLSLERQWKDGDRVEVDLPVEVRTVAADAKVKEDRGRMAIERGPMVYCAEWPDAEDGKVLELLFDPNGSMKPAAVPELYGGVTVIETAARKIANPSAAPKAVRLMPYCDWANRGAGEMSVWLSKAGYAMGDTGPAGGLIFYENPNYKTDGWRYLEAAPVDQSEGTKWGCFRKLIAGARGTAIGTGKQNTADMLAACTEPDGAAQLCANLNWNGVRGWFLPSRDELAAMYKNLKTAAPGAFRVGGMADNFTYWTSSQQTADMAAHIDFADSGRQHGDDKDFPRRVRAIRAF
jgi:uncharacterized protein